MLRAADGEVPLTLQHQEGACVSKRYFEHFLHTQLLQASSWASRFLHSAAGMEEFKRFTEVPHPGITSTNMKWSGERKGDRKDGARKGVQEADPK